MSETQANLFSIDVGRKRVFVSQPYQATASNLVGRQPEMELMSAAWMAPTDGLPLSPLLLGEPGVGKNRLVYEMAMRTGKDLYIFQGHEDVTAEDLACAVRFSDVSDTKMDYVVSPLVTAMLTGGICFIDEIAKIRPRALALLVSVLDERRYIDSTLLGERVYAKPAFRFVAATNTADLEGNAMPEFLRSRLRPIISVGYPDRDEINDIVTRRHPWLADGKDSLFNIFWMLWERGAQKRPPTPRDALYLFDLASSMADFETHGRRQSANEGGKLSLEIGAVRARLTAAHVERAFHELFGKRDGNAV